jgi:hypothetical protein
VQEQQQEEQRQEHREEEEAAGVMGAWREVRNRLPSRQRGEVGSKRSGERKQGGEGGGGAE